ncbi:MAG: glucose-6-phosphate dehydrogenase, partial [Acidimicrobiia bacterium]
MVDSHLFVILGGTGDLARRKLLPSLYRLITEEGVGNACVLLGAATTDLDDDGYRQFVIDALADAGLDSEEISRWCSDCVQYQPLTPDGAGYETLAKRITA